MYLYSAAAPLGAFANSSQEGHGWHTYSKGTDDLGAGATWGKNAKLNLTLPAAEKLCGAAADCAGFTFNDHDAEPAHGKVLSISPKTRIDFVAESAVGLQPSPIPASWRRNASSFLGPLRPGLAPQPEARPTGGVGVRLAGDLHSAQPALHEGLKGCAVRLHG